MNIYPYADKKGRRKWRYDKKVRGERIREQGFRTRGGCQNALSARVEGLKKIDSDFMRLCEEYGKYAETRFQPKTFSGKRREIREFLLFYGKTESPISFDILRYCQHRANSVSPDAYNRARKELSAMFEWGKTPGIDFCTGNPARQIEKMGQDHTVRYIPPIEDINAVLLVAGKYRDLLECILYTLGRKSEILRLRWEDIDFEQNTIRLWTRKRRGGGEESDTLPMPKPLQGILRRIFSRWDKTCSYVFVNNRNSGRYTQMGELMPRLCKKAGITPFTFHALRHYGASYLHRKGTDLKTVQLWLRHRNLQTTQQYIHEMPDSVRQAADVLGEIGNEAALF